MFRFPGFERLCRNGGWVVLGLSGLFAGCLHMAPAPQTPPHWPSAPAGDPFLGAPQPVPAHPPTLGTPQTAPVPDEAPQPTFDGQYTEPMPVESFRPAPTDLPPIIDSEDYFNPSVEPPRLEAPSIVPEDVTVPSALRLDVKAPETNTIGEVSLFEVTLQNSGDEPAENVTIESRFEDGLIFPGSTEKRVSQSIGTLAAGASRTLKLSLRSDRAGYHCAEFSLGAEGMKSITKKVCVQYREPSVSLDVQGPAKRMVGGHAEWNLTVLSQDRWPLSEARVVLEYDSTYLKPVGGSEGAKQELGRITWPLGTLVPSERVELQVEFECLMPVDETCLSFRVHADDTIEQSARSCLAVERRAGALDVDLQDAADPVQIGAEVEYAVTVTNRDLRAVHDVAVSATVPAMFRTSSTEVREGDQPLPAVRARVEGSTIRFESVDTLAPDATLTYRIKLKALEPGTGRLVVNTTSDNTASGTIRLEEVSTVVRSQ